jgi:hypothetical protein
VAAAKAAGANGAGGSATSLVDYLDELDAALTKRPSSGTGTASALRSAEPPIATPAGEKPAAAHNDWDISFEPVPQGEAIAEPLGPETPRRPPLTLTADAGMHRATPHGESETRGSDQKRPALPALAEAFAALLAVEQGAPASSAQAWHPAPAITDELVERVAALVVERLSDRVLRETVSDRVSAVAERLIREEIDRIKANIK